MKYKLIIFDLDGTILNTLDDLTDSTNYALRRNGFPERTLQEVRSFVGNGIANLIRKAVPDGSSEEMAQKVLADFTTYYGVHCADKTNPYEGILELMDQLKHAGCQLSVVSNKADFAVQALCTQYFPGVFDYVVGERECIRRKPAPDTVREVLRTLKVAKEDAVYIGDSEVDVQTAVNSQMDMIAVLWGFRNKKELVEQGAQILAEVPQDIYDSVQ